MASLEMDGPYNYTSADIDRVVTKKVAGNYALGNIKTDGSKTFIVEYVGRSDSNVNQELKQYLSKGYSSFKFSYASSVKAAFEKECRNYHDFGEKEQLDNDRHPDRPDGKDWECPTCTLFDK